MSKPTINIEIECTKLGFTFCDNTGKFGTNGNTTGWKPGDYSINNVTSAQLRITVPNGTVITKVVSPNIPSLNCTCIEILAADLSVTEIEAGKYKFEYFIYITNSVTGSQTIIKTTKYVWHLYQVICCIEGKKKKLTRDCEKDKCVYQMDLMLEAAQLALCKGDETSAGEIVEYLKSKCNCKCC